MRVARVCGPTRATLGGRGARFAEPGTGEEIEKAEVVKGYEYGRGQFITFIPAELNALGVESSKVIDLEKFVSRNDIDPIYFDSPYFLYPDGPMAVETLRAIGAAMRAPVSSGSCGSRSAADRGPVRSHRSTSARNTAAS